MRKQDLGHWLMCGDELEPQFVRPKDGRVRCPRCGQQFPLYLEGVVDDPAPESGPGEPEASAA